MVGEILTLSSINIQISKLYVLKEGAKVSNIEFETTGQAMILYCDYKKILQSKIDSVCKKIGFDDSKIQWKIYDPKTNKTSLKQMFVGLNGEDYGYCNPRDNIICISTLSIQKDASNSLLKKYNSLLRLEKDTDDFLANVIIDEITHIQTQSNHGSSTYDNKFKDNVIKYYLSPFDRIMSKIN